MACLLAAKQFYVPLSPSLPQSHDKDRTRQSVGTMGSHMPLPQGTVAVCLLAFHDFQMTGVFGKQLVSMGSNVTIEEN